jgi:hypothetical protein
MSRTDNAQVAPSTHTPGLNRSVEPGTMEKADEALRSVKQSAMAALTGALCLAGAIGTLGAPLDPGASSYATSTHLAAHTRPLVRTKPGSLRPSPYWVCHYPQSASGARCGNYAVVWQHARALEYDPRR